MGTPDVGRPRHILGGGSKVELRRRRHGASAPVLLLRCREVAPPVWRRARNVCTRALVCMGAGGRGVQWGVGWSQRASGLPRAQPAAVSTRAAPSSTPRHSSRATHQSP